MRSRLLTSVCLVLLILSSLGFSTTAVAADNPVVTQASAWLKSQQQASGGYAGMNGSVDPGTTASAVLGFASAGIDPSTVTNGGPSLVEFLKSQAATYSSKVGGAANLTLAAVAAGQDPRDFGGVNLVQAILAHLDHASGLFDPQIYIHAYAMLALSAAGETVPQSAVTALEHHQAIDGGWAFTGATGAGQADSNTTAVAIEALVANGNISSPSIAKAQAYLATLRTSDGLYAYQATPGTPLVGDANSTALVIQAMLATGQAAGSAEIAASLTALGTLRNSGSGAFYYRSDAKDDNLLATVQAIPALEEKPLPIWPVHAPGRTLAQAKAGSTAGNPQLCVYFKQTKHNACQGFLAYWQHFGGVDAFGYPLTEEFTYVDPATGRPTTMQYFERARFEWHPGSAPQRYDVQLGLLGSESLSRP